MLDKARGHARYSIQEVAKISGLAESTLRYYETVGILPPIDRDASSRHRRYSEGDLEMVVSIACLNATGMSLEDMRRYIGNRQGGKKFASVQIGLLEAQHRRLAHEAVLMKLRRAYVEKKIEYWKAIAGGGAKKAQAIAEEARGIGRRLHGTSQCIE